MQVLTQSEYFGSLDREVRHRGIGLSEYHYYTPGTPWHYHENPYFMYVIEGNMKDVNRTGDFLLPPGSMLFLNWGEAHRTEKHGTRGRGFHLQLERQWLRELGLEVGLWEGNQVLLHPDFHLLLGRIYFEFRRADEYSLLSIELLVLQLCGLLTDAFGAATVHAPPWINRLRDMLHAEGDEPLSLAALSKELGVHPVHISRTVPTFFDSTLGEYLRKRRLSKALPLLLDRRTPLVQVALGSGFSDQSHFTRVFRSYFGVTPAGYRRGS